MSSILGSFDNISQSIDDFKDTPNAFKTIWNAPDVSYALQSIKSANWNKNPGYMFKIEGGELTNNEGQKVSGEIIKYYRLQINPQSIEQSEPFSIRVIPTQTGIITENEGFVTKDLIISGTTGIYPKRPGTGYLTLGKSGYEDFMEFRNFIREYAELKTTAEGKNSKLIFRNYKDNEFWYVEPLQFNMLRNKDKPFSYDYKITFKIVGKPVPDFEFPQVLTNFVGDIDKIFNTIDASIEVFNSSISFLQSIEGSVENILLQPLRSASVAISAIKDGVNIISSLPREFYSNLLFETKRIRDNTCDLLGLGDSNYDETYNRDATLSGIPATYINKNNLEVLKAFSDTETALNQLICTDKYFDENTSKVTINNQVINSNSILSTDEILEKQISSKKNILAMFNNEISLPTPSSVIKTNVQTNDTLERIAVRYLGNASRWIEIMALNNLKSPYIDETLDQEGVLNPGDEILLPSNSTTNISNENIVSTRTTKITRNLTQQEKALGIDLLLNTQNDLITNNRQDLELVYGYDNIKQALMLNIAYEKGSLLYHPKKGIGILVGEKNDLMIDDLYQSIRNSILSDPRFLNVNQLRLEKDQGTVKLEINVTLAKTKQQVPLLLTF